MHPVGGTDGPVAPGRPIRAVVLVEGDSDRAALEALARRRGRVLSAAGVAVVAMGGITNIGHHLRHYGPAGLDVRLAGLYDLAERGHVERAVLRAGLLADPDGAGSPDLGRIGFHACDADLEDELIRALGEDGVLRVIAGQGELTALRSLQRQPAQRSRSTHAHLRRFLGSRSGRKRRYGALLVAALDPAAVPPVLDHP